MRGMLIGLIASMSIGAALAATNPSDVSTAPEEISAEALYGGIEADLIAICPLEDLQPYFEALSAKTTDIPLEVVIDVLDRLSGDDALCATAREAVRQAGELARFAQASDDDATGSIGETTNAPFSFGGGAPPGGAGYL